MGCATQEVRVDDLVLPAGLQLYEACLNDIMP